MRHVRFCILGAGPSGLAFATALARAGCDSFVVLEKEPEAGGLCRSAMVDGAPLDVGGGHFLDLRRRPVLDHLFRYLPEEEWQAFDRVAKIRLRGVEVDHPLEGNLWQLPLAAQVDFLESIAQAGCVRGAAEPNVFEDWVPWKLGERIAEEYMLPYNRKIWSMPLSSLGNGWLHKLPAVSFRETLQSCLERSAGGNLPAHGRFLYPRKTGYGEVWRRMGASLGDRLVCGYSLQSIDIARRTIDGAIQADTIVSTIPWPIWCTVAVLPEPIRAAIDGLEHTSIVVDYQPENLPSPAHWIYEPDESLPHHRQLLRHNFVAGSRGHWTETNARRARPVSSPRFVNDYAYPVATAKRDKAIATLLAWSRANGIVGLGRWGTWEHINSDVAVEAGLACARELLVS
jgi:protoporphyrinogen oxidase